MTTVLRDLTDEKPYEMELLVMVECPVCGAKKGEDYAYYSWHVRAEHDPEDVGLGEHPDRETVER